MLGHSHALSGAVAGIAAGVLLHMPVSRVAALAGFTAGMALLPDQDKCGSSPARCLGFLSEARPGWCGPGTACS
jgi:LexA-binding, inner membrane-associated putative hydrolase